MSRIFALVLSLVIFAAAVSTAHLKDGVDEIPVIIVLAQEGPSLYDPDASEDEDFPNAIPVRLLRGNGAGKWASVLKTNGGTVSPENAHRLYLHAVAPSQQSFYHRQEILRI
jgi:hypothetical protein